MISGIRTDRTFDVRFFRIFPISAKPLAKENIVFIQNTVDLSVYPHSLAALVSSFSLRRISAILRIS